MGESSLLTRCLLTLIFGAVLHCGAIAQGQEADDHWPEVQVFAPAKEGTERETDDDDLKKYREQERKFRPDWSQLVLSDERKIIKVRFMVFAYDGFAFRLEKHKADYQSNDQDLLDAIKLGLSDSSRPAAVSQDQWGGFSDIPMGQLQIRTTKDTFAVTMGARSFGVGDRVVTHKTRFKSYTLAQVVAKLYAKTVGTEKNKWYIRDLSGESSLEGSRRLFQEQVDLDAIFK